MWCIPSTPNSFGHHPYRTSCSALDDQSFISYNPIFSIPLIRRFRYRLLHSTISALDTRKLVVHVGPARDRNRAGRLSPPICFSPALSLVWIPRIRHFVNRESQFRGIRNLTIRAYLPNLLFSFSKSITNSYSSEPEAHHIKFLLQCLLFVK